MSVGDIVSGCTVAGWVGVWLVGLLDNTVFRFQLQTKDTLRNHKANARCTGGVFSQRTSTQRCRGDWLWRGGT